jgi:hypothetical protein
MFKDIILFLYLKARSFLLKNSIIMFDMILNIITTISYLGRPVQGRIFTDLLQMC